MRFLPSPTPQPPDILQNPVTCLVVKTWGGGCHWHLEGRGHRCCSPSTGHSTGSLPAPTKRMIWLCQRAKVRRRGRAGGTGFRAVTTDATWLSTLGDSGPTLKPTDHRITYPLRRGCVMTMDKKYSPGFDGRDIEGTLGRGTVSGPLISSKFLSSSSCSSSSNSAMSSSWETQTQK